MCLNVFRVILNYIRAIASVSILLKLIFKDPLAVSFKMLIEMPVLNLLHKMIKVSLFLLLVTETQVCLFVCFKSN